jgi:hypothetical protein
MTLAANCDFINAWTAKYVELVAFHTPAGIIYFPQMYMENDVELLHGHTEKNVFVLSANIDPALFARYCARLIGENAQFKFSEVCVLWNEFRSIAAKKAIFDAIWNIYGERWFGEGHHALIYQFIDFIKLRPDWKRQCADFAPALVWISKWPRIDYMTMRRTGYQNTAFIMKLYAIYHMVAFKAPDSLDARNYISAAMGETEKSSSSDYFGKSCSEIESDFAQFILAIHVSLQ